MITLHEPRPEPPRRWAPISRRLERAFIALCLAVILTIVILLVAGVIPLWLISP